MTARRSHYELAFEAYLSARGTAFVAIEDVKHFVKGRIGMKLFDYIVYPPGEAACLVDVKGRKSRITARASDCRQRNWVTLGDIEGLMGWQKVFGEGYEPTFVFAYWLVGADGESAADLATPKGASFGFAGRRYSFWLADVPAYAEHQKPLSKRWNTVSVPREDFRLISRSLDGAWSAAPC